MIVRLVEHVILPERCRIRWVDGASGNGQAGRHPIPREFRVDDLAAAAPPTGIRLESGRGGIAVRHLDRGRTLPGTPPTEEAYRHALYTREAIDAHLADPAGVPFPAELYAEARITATIEDPRQRYLPNRMDVTLPSTADPDAARANARVEVPLFPDAAIVRHGTGGGIEGQLAWDADRPAAYARITVAVSGDVDWIYEAQCNAAGLFRIPLLHTPAQALGAPAAAISVRATQTVVRGARVENVSRSARIASEGQATVRIATPVVLHYGDEGEAGVANGDNTVVTHSLRPRAIGRLTSENLTYVRIAPI